jgi:hypothetical protein
MSNYPQSPPSYGAVLPPGKVNFPTATDPFLDPPAGSSSNAFYNQPSQGDVPDDFKVEASLLSIFSSVHHRQIF